MNAADLYRVWAPDESVWSRWAKPILFAESRLGNEWAAMPPWQSIPVFWAPSLDNGTAVILDVEGANSVWLSLALAQRGFRPVPLFNGTTGPASVIDVDSIISALRTGAGSLGQMPIQPTAPPVFLLDSLRSGDGLPAAPGRFDNRWAVFPQDFPSANFLLANGIQSVLVAQSASGAPRDDLAHVLLRWQEAQIQILKCDIRSDSPPELHRVTRPGNFRHLWYRALVMAGLRRNSAGGFGAVVPIPTQSSGYG